MTLAGGVTGNGNSLTVGGNGVFGTVSGVNVLHVTGAATLNTVSAGSVVVDGTTAIDSPTIATTGTQQYTGAVTLNIGATLTGTTVTFGSSLDGQGHALTIAGNGIFAGVSGMGALHVTGAANFGGAVGAASVVVDGASAINTSTISTTGTQTYGGPATLGINTTLAGTTVTFGNSLIGAGHDLTVAGNGVFNVVSGVGNLHDTGAATFDGTVAAGALVVDGASQISTASITTTGNQTYSGGATVTKTTSLTGNTVTLSALAMGGNDVTVHGNGAFGAVTGTGNLHVTGAGTFAGNVAAGTLLVDGTSVIGANIVTTGNQTYTGSRGGDVEHDLRAGQHGEIQQPAGDGEQFADGRRERVVQCRERDGRTARGWPGDVRRERSSEGSIVVDGATAFNAGNITTTGTQTYTGTATVGQTVAA